MKPKKIWALWAIGILTSVGGIQAASVTSVLASTGTGMSPVEINLNGNTIDKTSEFTTSNEKYIPIWYVMSALNSLHINSKWENGNILVQVSPSTYPKLTNPSKNSGNGKMYLNGIFVGNMSVVEKNDPATGKQTAFVAENDVAQLLNRIGIQTSWANNIWSLNENNFNVFSSIGIYVGTVPSLSAAMTMAENHPDAIIQDEYRNIVARSPVYRTYSSIHVFMNAYSTLQEAVQGLNGHLDGYVLDEGGNKVYQATYRAYSSVGIEVGDYQTESEAQNALSTHPQGYVLSGLTSKKLYVAPVYFAYSSIGVPVGYYISEGDAKNALAKHPGGYVKDATGKTLYQQPIPTPVQTPTPTNLNFDNVDLRFAAPGNINTNSINNFLKSHNSPMYGLGQTIMDAQAKYGVDANYLVSHAILESAWGTSQIARDKNNLYGYGAYDWNPGVDAGDFPSEEYAILFEAWDVRNNYLNPGSSFYVSPTLTGMNVHYASDQTWHNSIAGIMNEVSNAAGGNINQYQQFSKNEPTPPAPKSTTEPVFYLDGAKATVNTGSNGADVPVYSNPTFNMYPELIQTPNGNAYDSVQKSWVEKMQNALNAKNHAGLTIDGGFGPLTASALEAYQKKAGLNPVKTSSGEAVCDLATWEKLLGMPTNTTLKNGQVVSVDQMQQSMVGDLVVEWVHVVGYGWVDSEYIKFNNVYSLSVGNPSSASDSMVPIYGSNDSTVIDHLHYNDYVVSNNVNQNGYSPVQYVNMNGDGVNGYVSGSQTTLKPVNLSNPY